MTVPLVYAAYASGLFFSLGGLVSIIQGINQNNFGKAWGGAFCGILGVLAITITNTFVILSQH